MTVITVSYALAQMVLTPCATFGLKSSDNSKKEIIMISAGEVIIKGANVDKLSSAQQKEVDECVENLSLVNIPESENGEQPDLHKICQALQEISPKELRTVATRFADPQMQEVANLEHIIKSTGDEDIYSDSVSKLVNFIGEKGKVGLKAYRCLVSRVQSEVRADSHGDKFQRTISAIGSAAKEWPEAGDVLKSQIVRHVKKWYQKNRNPENLTACLEMYKVLSTESGLDDGFGGSLASIFINGGKNPKYIQGDRWNREPYYTEKMNAPRLAAFHVLLQHDHESAIKLIDHIYFGDPVQKAVRRKLRFDRGMLVGKRYGKNPQL